MGSVKHKTIQNADKRDDSPHTRSFFPYEEFLPIPGVFPHIRSFSSMRCFSPYNEIHTLQEVSPHSGSFSLYEAFLPPLRCFSTKEEFLPIREASFHMRRFSPYEVFLWMLVEDLKIMSLSIRYLYLL